MKFLNKATIGIFLIILLSASYVVLDTRWFRDDILVGPDKYSFYVLWEQVFKETPVDNTAPTLLSGYVGALTPDVVTLQFDENLDSAETATVASNLTYNDGGSVTIDSVSMAHGGLLYLHTDSVYADSTLLLSYTLPGSGGIQDSTGNRTAAFTNFSIDNNLVGTIFMDHVHYDFENDVIDQAGNHNGIVEVAMTYESSSPDPAEGTYSAYFGPSADDQILYVPSTYDLPNRFSIACWLHLGNTDPGYIITNVHNDYNDGFRIDVDWADKELLFGVEQGASGWAYASSGNNDVPANDWFHLVVSGIVDEGWARVYIDGVDESDDNSVHSDWDTEGDDGRIRIGYTLYGNIDDFRIITDTISATEALWLKNNPGEPFYRTGAADPTPDDPSDFTTYADSLWACDFEDNDLGTYYIDDWSEDFGPYGQYSDGLGYSNSNCEIVSSGGTKCFRVTNGAGEIGASAGFQRNQGISQYGVGEEVYMSCNIMFESGFDAVRGGKLPIGFAGDTYPDVNQPYNTLTDDGFWFLIMFRPDEMLSWYLRWVDMVGNYGNDGGAEVGRWKDPTDYSSNFIFTGGTWYNFTIRMVLNDVGQANGLMEAFINGKLASQWLNLEFRLSHSVGIDWAVYSYFFGGNEATWEPSSDTWIQWDDIYIFNYLSHLNIPRGTTPSGEGRTLTLPDPDGKWTPY